MFYLEISVHSQICLCKQKVDEMIFWHFVVSLIFPMYHGAEKAQILCLQNLNWSILNIVNSMYHLLHYLKIVCTTPELAFVSLLLKEDEKIFGHFVVSVIFSMAQERRKSIFVKRVWKHDFYFFDRCLPLIPPFKMLGHSLSTRPQSPRWIFSI